jgi:hypothetical protein
MAEARILRNRRFCPTASSSGEVFVIVLGRTGESPLLASPSNKLLLKVVGWMLVLCVCDGDFMVVVGIRVVACFEKVGCKQSLSEPKCQHFASAPRIILDTVKPWKPKCDSRKWDLDI